MKCFACIYRVGRVLSFLSSRQNWDYLTPLDTTVNIFLTYKKNTWHFLIRFSSTAYKFCKKNLDLNQDPNANPDWIRVQQSLDPIPNPESVNLEMIPEIPTVHILNVKPPIIPKSFP